MSRKLMTILSLLVVVAMLVAACGGGREEPAAEEPAAAEPAAAEPAAAEPAAEEPAAEEPAAEEPAAEEPAAEATEPPAEEPAAEPTEAPAEEPAAEVAMTAYIPGGDLEKAMAGEYAGTVVSMMGPFVQDDERKFNDSVAAFEEATGIDIQYEGTQEFETIINTRVDGGDAPDIADFPQPGLLANHVRDGSVVDVSTFMPEEYLKGQYLDSWLDMAQMEGPDGPITAGVWTRFNGKSLVWYPKKAFDEAGYTVPTTWAELEELQATIASDGDTPWCIGIESGAATGWAATDWMEEFMLRTTSLENYDKWVAGELKFASPEVKAAAEKLAEIWLNPDYVFGGADGIVSTAFGDAPAPMFEDPPRCWLHKQGNFITSFFPQGLQAGVDYDVFYLPGIDEQYGKPFLVAGDIYAMFNDRPEVRAAMEFFSRGESLKEWLGQAGTLATQKDVQLDWYGDDVERGVAELAMGATSVRFDASDLMPGEVGAGSFWTGMTSWIAGNVDLDTALAEIDASWPTD